MTEAEAEATLARMIDAESDPVLSDEDMEDLLLKAARPDVNGLTREDANWVPTWDLDSAAADGWLRKASKAVSRFSFAEDGQRFERAQIYAHCIRMQEMFARKSMGTLQSESVGRPLD